jgi:hypothetical protein
MKNLLAKIVSCWPYLVFLLLSLTLILTREPFIDEAWYTYPALTFLREGGVLDITGGCQYARIHPFNLAPTCLAYALWYKVGEVNIVWGRMVGVICGFLFLVILNKCFKMIRNGQSQTYGIVLGIVGTNYFFLSAISQIRPEALALLASSLSLYMYLLWQEDTKSVAKILLAHLFVILAAMFHWQSAFMAFGLWLAYLFTDRREISLKHLLSILALYLLFIVIYFVCVYPLWDEFINFTFGRLTGDMAGHRGGMVAAISRYWQTGQVVKLATAVCFISVVGINMVRFWSNHKGRQAVFWYCFAGFLSWTGTTSSLDDYHAVWLVYALMAILIYGFEDFKALGSGIGLKRIISAAGIGACVILSILGWVYAIKSSYENPRANIYEKDLKGFNAKFRIDSLTPFSAREAMWHFEFNSSNTFVRSEAAEYHISRPLHGAAETLEICGKHYALVKKGEKYGLYRRMEIVLP